MAYILLAALIFAVGWGLKSAMSIPHPDGLTVILSSTVVLTDALFWVVVTLQRWICWWRSSATIAATCPSSLPRCGHDCVSCWWPPR